MGQHRIVATILLFATFDYHRFAFNRPGRLSRYSTAASSTGVPRLIRNFRRVSSEKTTPVEGGRGRGGEEIPVITRSAVRFIDSSVSFCIIELLGKFFAVI